MYRVNPKPLTPYKHLPFKPRVNPRVNPNSFHKRKKRRLGLATHTGYDPGRDLT